MNYELLRKKMDSFFAETSGEELISKFKDLGYEFIDNYQFDCNKSAYTSIKTVSYLKETSRWWPYFNKLKNETIKKSDLENFEVFFLKLQNEYKSCI